MNVGQCNMHVTSEVPNLELSTFNCCSIMPFFIIKHTSITSQPSGLSLCSQYGVFPKEADHTNTGVFSPCYDIVTCLIQIVFFFKINHDVVLWTQIYFSNLSSNLYFITQSCTSILWYSYRFIQNFVDICCLSNGKMLEFYLI